MLDDSREAVIRPGSALLSPTLSAVNGLSVSKRQASYGRAAGSVRASSGRFTNTLVRDQHIALRQKCQHEFGASVDDYVFNTSYEGLLKWIKSERMMRLPHKGGTWDRVLISARYFADQVHTFNSHVEMFTEESGAATNFVFGQCLLLLSLGHENAPALEKAFGLFYQFGLELSPLLERADLFVESRATMEGLDRAFADLLQIVAGTSITFYQAVHSGRPFTRVDIFASFSSLIDTFRLRVHRCSHEMWSMALARHSKDGCEVDTLQKWLAPEDSVLAFLSSNHINVACRPEQFTCQWFQPHLSSFLKGKDNILLVEGKAGSGKTTLAHWAVDRMRRQIARKHVSTISFCFDHSVAAQATPLTMLRTYLNQLLAINIGNIGLFDAINEAYTESKNSNAEELEAKLWQAFSKALNAISNEHEDSLAIVVDGVVESDTLVQASCKKLHELAIRYLGVRLIQFSQPLNQQPASSVRVNLSIENLSDDIRTLIRRKLHIHNHFKDREIGDQENIIEQIATAAGGNMLWTYLACMIIRRQDSCKAFDESLRSLVGGPLTVTDLVKRLFKSLDLDSDCKTLLSLLVTAGRPLQLIEIEALLRVDVKHLTVADKHIDLKSMLSRIRTFIIGTEGLVAIRHEAVRQAILGLNIDADFTQILKNRHQDILTRLFISTKSSLRAEHEPTLVCLQNANAINRLHMHPLLEYTVRYWTTHFQKSSMFKAHGDLQLSKEFKKIFAESVTFCLLEEACWSAENFSQQALVLHVIAFRVRKALFGDNHACVLQSALFCAMLCDLQLSRREEAVEWYALAARIASVVAGVQADITITCCNTLLRISETLVSKKRTTFMTFREEALLILVRSYEHRYGSTSKEVLEIYKRLHALYIHIEEETKAIEIIQIIHKLTIEVYGEQSDEARSISREASVVLKNHKHVHDVETIDGFLFQGYTEEKEELLTLIYIEKLIKLAASYVSRGEFSRAEEHYIELWLKLTEHCHVVHLCEWHEKKIQVMLIYAQFLQKQERYSEASAILVAIWTEYEHHEFSMFESIVILLKEVAVSMRSLKLLTIALLVFHKCWNFFKYQHKEHLAIFTEISEYISRTSTEIVTTITETTETSSETVIRTVFEHSITSSETVSITTITLCKSLVYIYRKEQRWSEAVSCIKQLLLKSWSTFFSESIEGVLLIESYSKETIELAVSLAECYVSMRRYEKAEEIYLRIYRAYRNHRKIEDLMVIKYSETLLAFYAAHEMFTKAITFYQELLVDYRACYGVTDARTIKILYALGKLCRRHQANYGYWLEYYLEIVINLNKGALICHTDAFDALLIVAEHYYETLRYSESLVYFKSIFATFCKHGLKIEHFKKKSEIKILVEHYLRSIEESKIEVHVHIQILKELRHACEEYYGKSEEITIFVTVKLAESCCKIEEHHFQMEAISFYELVMQHKTKVTEEIVKRVEVSLRTLYVKQVTSKSTTTTMTSEMIERATTLLYKRYVETRKHYSCTHEVTLTSLRELVMFYHQQKKLDLAIKELKSVIVDCIKVVSAKELIEAATSIAAIYMSCGIVAQGIELIRELKLQIIYSSTSRCSQFGFNVTSLGRTCFAFIAAFEYHLRAVYTISLASYMSNLLAEYLFYERLMSYIKTEVKLEKVFVCGARLRQILVRSHRVIDFTLVENKVLDYFVSTQKAVLKHSSKETVKVFVSIVLIHFSQHAAYKSWTATIGHAAVAQIETLLRKHNYKEALDLTTCTFHFLMAHQGLDDETEITLGFHLCLLMASRTKDKSLNHKCDDPAIRKSMLDLSQQILAEVFDICKQLQFNLARCRLSELNSLLILIGEQQDFARLQWLLELLWSSREGQSAWSSDVVLQLGKRLVQAQFAAGSHTSAIRLCENIVYNVRRVHGTRHHYTVTFYALLASMYTTLACKYIKDAAGGTSDKKHAEDMARVYFRKAIEVHEEVLKQIVSAEDADSSDDDDDESDHNGVGPSRQGTNGVTNGTTRATCGFAWRSHEQELESVRAHIRRLQLAVQRYGNWVKPSNSYEKLTSRVWDSYGKESGFNMAQDQVLANKWQIEKYGSGKAEGTLEEDGFKSPKVWWIVESEA